MVTFLRLFQGGGMGGGGHLPEAVMDQPVVMLQALTLMAAFEDKLRDEKAGPFTEDGGIDYAEKERRAMASWGVT